MRGLSLLNPLINETVPNAMSVLGRFSGNVAHSSYVGFRVYPRGFHPRFNATVSGYDWVRLSHIRSLAYSLTHSLILSLTHSLILSLTHSLTHSRAYLITHTGTLTHPPTHSLTPFSLTRLFTHLSYSLPSLHCWEALCLVCPFTCRCTPAAPKGHLHSRCSSHMHSPVLSSTPSPSFPASGTIL